MAKPTVTEATLEWMKELDRSRAALIAAENRLDAANEEVKDAKEAVKQANINLRTVLNTTNEVREKLQLELFKGSPEGQSTVVGHRDNVTTIGARG